MGNLDVRKVCSTLFVWQAASILALYFLGNGQSEYLKFHFGPSEDLTFLNYVINTWARWGIFISYMCIDTFINTFGDRIMFPWITNVIMNESNTELPHRKRECFIVTNGYYAYSSIRGILLILIAMTQLDFLLIKILTDFMAQLYITDVYIKDKEYYPPSDYSAISNSTDPTIPLVNDDPCMSHSLTVKTSRKSDD